jgi:hypothetical protein
MKGNLMAVMDYRTKDGLADFGFSIEFQSDIGWRVYIIFDPFCQGHDHSVDLPYQSIDRDGRCYVNWSSKLDSLGDAKTVAGVWAELAQRDQRAKKEHALYAELIQRYWLTQKQNATPANPDRLDDAVNTRGAGPGHQDHSLIIPHARAPAKLLSDPQQRQRCRLKDEVA